MSKFLAYEIDNYETLIQKYHWRCSIRTYEFSNAGMTNNLHELNWTTEPN